MSHRYVSVVRNRWSCAKSWLNAQPRQLATCCQTGISQSCPLPSNKIRLLDLAGRHFSNVAATAAVIRGNRTIRQNQDIGASDILSLMKKFRGAKIIAAPEIEQLMDMIKKVPGFSLTSTDGSFLLWCCEKLMPRVPGDVKVKVASEVVDLLQKSGRADISHFNQLLTIYLDNSHDFVPTDFLTRLREVNVEANRVTYTRLLTRLGNLGDLAALKILQERMEQLGMAKSEAIYTPLLNCLIKHRQFDDVEATIKEMRSKGFDTTDTTLGMMLKTYAALGELNKLKEILATANSKNIRLNTRDYLTAASSLYEIGHSVEAIELLNDSPRKMERDYKKICAEHIGHLCSLDKFDLAYDILLTTVGSEHSSELVHEDPVVLFLTGLVENNAMPDMVIRFAREIYDKKLNRHPMDHVIRHSYVCGKFDVAEEYLRRYPNSGGFRHGMFLPLLVQKVKENKFSDFCKTLEWMDEHHLFLDYDCFKNLIYPHLPIPFPKFISFMQDNVALKRYNKTCLVSSFVAHCIANRRLVELRSTLAMSLAVPVNIEYLTRTVSHMFYGSQRNTSYAYPMDYLTEVLRNFQQFLYGTKTYRGDGGKEIIPDGITLNNEIIREIIQEAEASDERVIKALLKDLCVKDIAILPEVLQLIKTTYEKTFPSAASDVVVELVKLNESRVFAAAPKVDSDLSTSPSKPHSSGVVYQLFQACETSDKPEEVEALLAEFKKQPRFRLEGSLVACLILFYTRISDVEKAMEWFDKSVQEGISLNPRRHLQLAAMLLKKNQQDRAIKVLQSCTLSSKYRPGDESSPVLVSVNILLREAMQQSPQIFEKFLSVLESRGLDSALLERFCRSGIQFCLQRNDLLGALDHFNRCVNKYGGTKGARELMIEFIKREDKEALEKIFDKVCATHGKAKGFADLAVCLIHTKKLTQAEKIFSDTSIEVDSGSLLMAARRLAKNGRVEELRDFLKVSKNYRGLRRTVLYDFLIQACHSKNAWQAALEAWTDMQEENTVATNRTLRTLEALLVENNQKVPFQLSGEQHSQSSKTAEESDQSFADSSLDTASISGHLNETNVDKAIKVITESDGSSLLYGNVINFLAAQKRLSEAVNLLLLSVQRDKMPSVMVIKSLFESLSDAGDFATLEKLKSSITPRLAELYEVKEFIELAKINGSAYQSVVDRILSRPDSPISSKILVKLALKHPDLMESVLNKFLTTTSVGGRTNLANLWKHLTVHDPQKAYSVLERDPDIDSRAGSSFLLKLFSTFNDEKGVRQRLETSNDPRLSGIYYSHLIFLKLLKNNINAAVTIQQEAHQNGIAEDLLKRSVILRLSNSTRKGSNQAAESGISEDASEGVSSKST